MSERTCQTCGGPVNWWPGKSGRRPNFCSDKCRKASYGGRCLDCGALTDGSNGRGKAATRCAECAHANQHAHRYWTEDRIVAAFKRWTQEHGRQPSADDWRVQDGGYWPPTSQVQRILGSWAALPPLAGYAPLQGYAWAEDFERTRRLYEEGMSVADIAQREGRSEYTIRWRLRKVGLELPSRRGSFTAAERETAITAYLAGASLEEAGCIVGASGFAVYWWMKGAGIARRPRGPRKVAA